MLTEIKSYCAGHSIAAGMAALACSCLFWALNYTMYKVLVSHTQAAPATLIFWIFTFGGVVMAVIAGMTIGFKAAFVLPKSAILPVVGQGICGLGLTNLFVLSAEQRTSAINVTMLEALIPVFVLLGSAMLGYKLKKIQLLGIFLGLSGCMLVIKALTFGGIALSALNLGDLFVSLGAVSWAIYVLWGQRTQKAVNASVYTVWTMFSAGLGMMIYALATGQSLVFSIDWQGILLLGVIILLPTTGAFFFWTHACVLLPLPLLNVTQYLTPLLAVVLAHLLLSEAVDGAQWFGMALIVGGILIDPEFRGEIVRHFHRNNVGIPPR